MTVLINVNLSPDWVHFLESAGYQALHWTMIGDCETADPEIVAYALRLNCVVLTQDRDYGTILSTTTALKPSVILIRAGRVNPVKLGAQVLAALSQLAQMEDQGVLITIDARRTRLSLLPLGKRT